MVPAVRHVEDTPVAAAGGLPDGTARVQRTERVVAPVKVFACTPESVLQARLDAALESARVCQLDYNNYKALYEFEHRKSTTSAKHAHITIRFPAEAGFVYEVTADVSNVLAGTATWVHATKMKNYYEATVSFSKQSFYYAIHRKSIASAVSDAYELYLIPKILKITYTLPTTDPRYSASMAYILAVHVFGARTAANATLFGASAT